MSFGSKKPQPETGRLSPSENTLSIISQGTVIDGNVYSDGDIRVEGKILGTLACKSRVVVGAQGRVEGNVDALNATIAGQVQGKVVVRDMLQLQETGKIFGDIITGKLTIQPGGEFSGTCKMGPDAADHLKQTPQPVLNAARPVLLSSPAPSDSTLAATAADVEVQTMEPAGANGSLKRKS